MTGILKVDQWKDSGDNALMTSDGAGNLNCNVNLGIGTTSPNQKLHLKGDAYTAIVLDGTSGGNVEFWKEGSFHADIYSAGTGDIIFRTNGATERLRINSNGLCIGGTGSANALDDYEEGTWTPVLRGDSWVGSLNYTQQQGIYIKVGRIVFVSVFLAWNANNFSSSSGRLDLQGLPFTCSNQNNYRGGVSVTYTSNAWTGLTIYQQAFRVESSASKFGFNFSDATDGTINTEISSHTHIQSSGSFMIGGTYATD